MKWIVVGARGMLGQDVTDLLGSRGEQVHALGRQELDVLDAPAVAAALEGADVVVNCAAYTAVDAAEDHEADAFALNAVGAAHVARAAAAHGARVVHVSTDYVFDGAARAPYGEDAPIAPSSAYGRTKAAGEWAVLAASAQNMVVRTAWLYGAGGGCFPRTIVRVARERGGVAVVTDQIGQPTWTRDVAETIARLVEADAPGGIYHATSSGEASWYEFARSAVEAAGLDADSVTPVTSESFVRPAPRPAYSVLGHERSRGAGVEPIGDWRDRWALAASEVLAG
ncbi:dTDP-4-dehydrorhamnose reductase [Cellulomonas sp. PhB143]|uniref:dTDP-4-dehydrorhamnose reductase n=1 Tax=Cellulomonas sp. PhB143 TaxID=2485186 RepID=UPI000F493C3D|nr:dTDP-4-dehydrorhamnose reductase [Cellulomonas sp. PhB143]ROS78573.1 dTDP-4-dehydrorhamnose reductase [Cellulomonas sp. PhB143]